MLLYYKKTKEGFVVKKINSLTVLKFLAMFLIVWWHIGKPTRTIDLGARMCEFLFVASGFLVGYNYLKKGMPNTISFQFKYVFNKIKKIWPLHVFMLLAFMLLNYETCILGFTLNDVTIFLSNLFLLQAWSPDVGAVCFSYNGVSWFLSALLFCYFLSPFFLRFIKNKRLTITLFIVIAIIRISIDLFISKGSNIFLLSTHTSPIVRSLEFFLGMLLVPSFCFLKEKLSLYKKKWLKILFTVIEISLLVSLYFILKGFNNLWQRSYFVLFFCFVIFIFAFDFGFFSCVCSNKYILKISDIQLEVYLMQIIVSTLIDKILILMNVQLEFWWLFAIKVIALIVFSILYKIFLENKIAKILEKEYLKVNAKNAK